MKQSKHRARSSVGDDREHLVAVRLDWIGFDVNRARRENGLAGRHVKPAEVQIALDGIAFERPLGEARQTMGATVIRGVKNAIDIVDRYRWSVGAVDTLHLTGRQIAGFAK
jgi:hypothetical protein